MPGEVLIASPDVWLELVDVLLEVLAHLGHQGEGQGRTQPGIVD